MTPVHSTWTDLHPVLAERAIQPRFASGAWGERYERFERGDWAAFSAGHSHPERWHKAAIVNQTGGFVINRWDIAGEPLHPYIRPDHAVEIWGHKGPSKYLFPAGARYPGETKRIDVHPLVKDRLLANTDERIYFCIEGCFKADAVAATGRLSISVPSITHWRLDQEHWEPWLPILQKAPVVYVIPDSDFLREPDWSREGLPNFINPMVRHQTSALVAELQSLHGVRARYAVPPYLRYQDAATLGIDPSNLRKRGIDDHIHDGGTFQRWNQDNLLGLHYYGGQIRDWSTLPRVRRDRQADKRDLTFMAHLEKTRHWYGMFGITQVASELNWGRHRVTRAWQSCRERGILRVDQGRPLGEGRGNKAHVYRFTIME